MNENYKPEENIIPTTEAPTQEGIQPEDFSVPTQDESTGSAVPPETNINASPEGFEEITPEDFKSALGIADYAEQINTLAMQESATKGMRTKALGNAFFAADPEEQKQIAEAQKIVAESKGESGLVEWVGKHGKKAMASLALIVGLGGMAQNANAGGLGDLLKSFNDPVIQKTVNKIGEGVNASHQLAEINRREQSLKDQITSLEGQKRLAIEQSEANLHIKSVENSVDSRVRPSEIEANSKAQRLQMELKKEESKKRFLGIQNPTGADLARYESEQSTLQAGMARMDGEYQKNVAREQGRSNVQNARVGVDSANANTRIHNIEAQQDRLAKEISALNFQRLQLLQRGGQAIFR